MMELNRCSATKLAALLERGEVSSKDIACSLIQRIADVEPQVRAFITFNKESLLAQAEESDCRRREGRTLSPWDGIPIALKDNISTRGLKTTCGSKMLANYTPPYDATVVERIKQAGLLVMGKTNMDEFAMGSSTENSAFFLTGNPHDYSKVPGGSSGGSAAAVGAREVPWSLGSDTGGSIRQPASFCGVVGLKPTYGLVSRYGLVAFASSLDQIGPIAGNVQDTAALLQIIAGHDQKDSTSVPQNTPQFTTSVRGERDKLIVGIPQEYFGAGLNLEVKEAVLSAVRRLEQQGAIIKEVTLPSTDYAIETYYLIATSEASSNLARYDGVRYGLRVEGSDALSMFKKTRSQGFGPEVKRRIILGTYALSAGYYDAYYKKAQQVRTLIRNEMQSALAEVDVLITPTTPTTAFGFGEKKDPMEMYLSDIYTVNINLAGVPGISVPCGTDSKGLPIGLQIVGNHFGEQTILDVAYTLECLAQGGKVDE